MRISACLHCALWAALLPFLSSATQTPLEEPAPTSTTLVDALNADPDYTSLLRLFQRTKLIPTLNRLNGSTLFAPTNDAIKKASLQDPIWLAAFQGPKERLTDNVQEQLRQQLFYHLLNESLATLPSSDNTSFYKTLLYPRKPLDPPSREPPPNPPWMPIPNGTLGREPQRLRVAAQESKPHVAVDAFGKGGVKIVKDGKNAGNGIIFGIDEIIIPPADLGMSRAYDFEKSLSILFYSYDYISASIDVLLWRDYDAGDHGSPELFLSTHALLANG
jgi:solute carrier family 25 carnitine/acylcarnitine transporter 20/29